MIWEDERAAEADRLGFVLHLGDFVYELVWYPEDRPQGMYDRRLRDVVRFPHGEKVEDFHVPTDLDDYRILYRGYLADPDLQDARARWPFVCIWDNHEFSWKGWQSQVNFGSGVVPAQTRKVAANQAWFEYQPARVEKAPGAAASADRFVAPAVRDVPIERFDDQGLGLEPGNLAAISSLKLFRASRFGANVELILTDNRSFRSEPIWDHPEVDAVDPSGVPYFVSMEIAEVLDTGRSFAGGRPLATVLSGGAEVANPRRTAPPQTMLGAAQKAWFLARLRASTARWRLWGNSVAHWPCRLGRTWGNFGRLSSSDGGTVPRQSAVEQGERGLEWTSPAKWGSGVPGSNPGVPTNFPPYKSIVYAAPGGTATTGLYKTYTFRVVATNSRSWSRASGSTATSSRAVSGGRRIRQRDPHPRPDRAGRGASIYPASESHGRSWRRRSSSISFYTTHLTT